MNNDTVVSNSSTNVDNPMSSDTTKSEKKALTFATKLIICVFMVLLLGVFTQILAHLDWVSSDASKEIYSIFREELIPMITFVLGYYFSKR